MMRLHRLWMGAVLLGTLLLNACGTIAPRSPAVTFNGACEQREEDNYYDNIRLKVNNNVVEQLEWTANPRQGRCQFNLADFSQVKTQPQVVDLQSKADRKCHVYMWNNGQYISVSVLNCQTVCQPNNHILPILLSARTGGCAQTIANQKI